MSRGSPTTRRMPFKASCVPGPISWYWIFVTGGTGMQVIQALRTGAHATSIVVLTNYATPGYRKRYLDVGARYFLPGFSHLGNMSQISCEIVPCIAVGTGRILRTSTPCLAFPTGATRQVRRSSLLPSVRGHADQALGTRTCPLFFRAGRAAPLDSQDPRFRSRLVPRLPRLAAFLTTALLRADPLTWRAVLAQPGSTPCRLPGQEHGTREAQSDHRA